LGRDAAPINVFSISLIANRRRQLRYSGISPLSDVQFSRFTETEVAKLLTFGRPRGALEVMVPMSDSLNRTDPRDHCYLADSNFRLTRRPAGLYTGDLRLLSLSID